MIILLGARGYLGQAFAQELAGRGRAFVPLSRQQLDYSRYDLLARFLREQRPEFLINAAGYTGRPNVDACEEARAETLQGNTLLPLTIAHACQAAGVPWGHISSGCIYAGAHIIERGQARVEKDLTRPDLKHFVETNPGSVCGYRETDEPNFTFRQPPCSFYSGTKALAEEALAGLDQIYLWRWRLPFDECDGPRNYLSKLQRYPKVYNNVNSLSHRADCARACLDLWERRAPFGAYNLTNPGYVTTRQVVALLQKFLQPARAFEFWANDDEFYDRAARTPRSSCVLDVSRLLATGMTIRPVEEAVVASLQSWKRET